METESLIRIKVNRSARKLFFLIIIVPIVLLIVIMSVYKVDTGQAIVITRFGRVERVEWNAGINFKLPVIEQVNRVSLARRHIIEYGFRELVPSSNQAPGVYRDILDEQMVIVEAVGNNSSLVLTELTVEYQVVDPVNYLYKIDDLESTIRLILEDVLRNVLQSVTLDEALIDKIAIDAAIKPEIQRVLDNYEAGIAIIEVKTQNTSLLPSVDVAYREVERANQYRNSKIEEAQKYRNTVVPQAEAEAAQLIEDARGYYATTITDANAAVAQFNAIYNEYIKNPEVIKEKIYTESMREFLLNNNIIMDVERTE